MTARRAKKGNRARGGFATGKPRKFRWPAGIRGPPRRRGCPPGGGRGGVLLRGGRKNASRLCLLAGGGCDPPGEVVLGGSHPPLATSGRRAYHDRQMISPAEVTCGCD